MKTRTGYLEFNTKEKVEFVLITGRIEKIVGQSGVKDGLVLINPMHVISAVIMNDNERGLVSDFKKTLERLVPYDAEYAHNVGEKNATAHIWRQLVGHQVVLPVSDGRLDLGTWEQIFYCEFDRGNGEKECWLR